MPNLGRGNDRLRGHSLYKRGQGPLHRTADGQATTGSPAAGLRPSVHSWIWLKTHTARGMQHFFLCHPSFGHCTGGARGNGQGALYPYTHFFPWSDRDQYPVTSVSHPLINLTMEYWYGSICFTYITWDVFVLMAAWLSRDYSCTIWIIAPTHQQWTYWRLVG